MTAPFGRTARPRRGGTGTGAWIFPAVVLVTVAAAWATAAGTAPLGVWVFVTVLGGWLITLCLHEFGHAVVALRGGDTSVRGRGYLTLNPLRYANGAMTFVIPLVILAIGGLPLPGGAVLIEHGRLRSRVWRSAVSLAGPLVNLVAGVLLTVLAAQFDSPLAFALSFLALLQFIAAILNLLPVPGLDGWGVIAPFLSARTQEAVRPFTPWAPFVLILLLFSSPQIVQPLWDASYWLFSTAGGDARWATFGRVLFQFWR
ncbi:site-2 protease family protein [Nakamurella deserti]|uniref:site-2 protease family protein n=1 Tax=Nakamurella deserti TaxID=2164074 RepID=UPI0013003B38|nr:site-2 protease family protein [Nakamurella deserti]